MRLASLRPGGEHGRLAVVRDGRALLASELVASGPSTMTELLERGPAELERLLAAAQGADFRRDGSVALGEEEVLAPVPFPGKVVAIGLNYHAHAAEQGVEAPREPIIFAKFTSAVVGHRHPIRWDPALTKQVDYEAELAVVIGRTARRVGESEALDYVLGYTCGNDVSARDLQFGDKQWVRGKSLDTFGPLGPVLVTRDEIPDPQRLAISCTVNGERLQEGTTGDMVFSVRELVAFCSRAFTLQPGDVILTGTPPGVGIFRKPPRLLNDGDEVVVEIEGIGQLVNVCEVEPGA